MKSLFIIFFLVSFSARSNPSEPQKAVIAKPHSVNTPRKPLITSPESKAVEATAAASDPCKAKIKKIVGEILADAIYHLPFGNNGIDALEKNQNDPKAWASFCLAYGRTMGAVKQLTWLTDAGGIEGKDALALKERLRELTHKRKEFCGVNPREKAPDAAEFSQTVKDINTLETTLKTMRDLYTQP